MCDIEEINYKKYKRVFDHYGEITDDMLDLAKANIFDKQEKYPAKLQESKKQILELKKAIEDNKKLTPISVEVDENDSFVTVIDGFHRIIAFRELGTVRCDIIAYERVM